MGLPLVHMATSEPPDGYVLCGAIIGSATFDSSAGVEDVTCGECLRLLAPTGAGQEPSMKARVHSRTTRFEQPDADEGYGVVAVAELRFEQADGSSIVQSISSPGLWGLGEKEDAAYLSEVEAEQNALLDGMLAALGLAGGPVCPRCGLDPSEWCPSSGDGHHTSDGPPTCTDCGADL